MVEQAMIANRALHCRPLSFHCSLRWAGPSLRFSTQVHHSESFDPYSEDANQHHQKPPHLLNLPFSRYSDLLQSCCTETSVTNGYIAHDIIIKSGFTQNTYLQNMLIKMYGQFGDMESACCCFYHIESPDRYSWNFIIKFLTQQASADKSFQFFYNMQCVGMLPDEYVLVSLLSACCSSRDRTKGLHLHACSLVRFNRPNAIVATAIANMYGKIGDLRSAQKAFGSIEERDCVTWNAMLALYDQHGHSQSALDLLDQMFESQVAPDECTFTSVVSACAGDLPLFKGRELHNLIIRGGLEFMESVQNSLINLYVQGGCLYDGRKIFDNSILQGIVSWTMMISGYLQHGLASKALFLLEQMLLEGIFPDQALLVTIFSSLHDLQKAKCMHAQIVGTKFEMDAKVGHALVNMYINSGSINEGLMAFNQLSDRELVSWTTMIAGYAEDGRVQRGLELLEQSRVEGVGQDKVLFITTLSTCINIFTHLDGKRIHACLISCGFDSDVSVGNALLNMYKRCGLIEDTLILFARMNNWNNVTFISLLSANTDQAAIQDGMLLHSCIVESVLEQDDPLVNALLTMYGRSGSLADANSVFAKACPKNLGLWNAMIECCAQNGCGNDALEVFEQALNYKITPDAATFVSVLSACGHSGLVDEAYKYVVSMSSEHGMAVEIDHYNCLVHLIGRIGRVEHAELIILNMPCQATSVSWLTLFSACREHRDFVCGEHAAHHAFSLDSRVCEPLLSLSNLYSAWGRHEDFAKAIERIKDMESEARMLCYY